MLLVLLALPLLNSPRQQERSNEVEFMDVSQQLQNGDLIFRRGRSVESQAVLISDRKSQYSHVGIVYIENKIPYIIHVVPGENKAGSDHVKKEKIDDFLSLKKASAFAVFRSDYSQEIINRAALNALRSFQKKRVFDTDYNLNSDDRLYCTELVIKAYERAINQSLNLKTTQLNFVFGKLKILMPGNIIENPHFHQIIIN